LYPSPIADPRYGRFARTRVDAAETDCAGAERALADVLADEPGFVAQPRHCLARPFLYPPRK
jgi:hypothetical protein